MSAGLDEARLADLCGRPRLRRVLQALDAPGEETRLVGGAVRDALLGRAVTDIDLATTLLPAETARRAAAAGLKAVPTGIAHGTVTVVAEGEAFEVTTLREDIETDGRHAVVRFGRDFARDAERRDFTVNALSAGADGRIHDTVGGLADLAAGRVRFIGARPSASARITCASCASSASTPATGAERRIPTASPPRSRPATASTDCRASGCGASC